MLQHVLGRPDLVMPLWLVFGIYQVVAIGLSYRHTTYQIKESAILICYGCFEQRRFELHQKQALVNYRIEQNWLQQLFRVSGITLYFKNSGDETEVTFCALKQAELVRLEQALNQLENNVEPQETTTGVSIVSGVTTKRLLLTGLLSANYLLMVPFVMDLAQIRDWVTLHVGINVVVNGWMIGILLAVMPAWSIGLQYFKYAKFKLIVHADYFVISNGWLERDRNVLSRDDVMGIKLEQNVGLRLLHLYQVSAILNDPAPDTQTKCLLLPFASEHQVRRWVENQFSIALGHQSLFPSAPRRRKITMAVMTAAALLAGVVGLYQLTQISWMWLLVLAIPPIMRPLLTCIVKDTADLLRVQVGYVNRSCYYLPLQTLGSETRLRIAQFGEIQILRTDQNPALRFVAIES
ncbi:PH domain-containing protein [Weissella viridescens]|nr:PH domain-containing protein [Weissella viridescens]